MLPYIGVFPESTNGMYQYDGVAGNSYIGENCALRSQPNGHFILLGFPLYFIYNNDAELFMTQLLDEIGEVGVDDFELEITNVELKNYPNPFNPTTTISFNLTTEITEDTELIIYNLKGQKIRAFDIIPNGVEGISNQQVVWNGTDQNDQPVSSGIYFYKLRIGDFEMNSKMLLLK